MCALVSMVLGDACLSCCFAVWKRRLHNMCIAVSRACEWSLQQHLFEVQLLCPAACNQGWVYCQPSLGDDTQESLLATIHSWHCHLATTLHSHLFLYFFQSQLLHDSISYLSQVTWSHMCCKSLDVISLFLCNVGIHWCFSCCIFLLHLWVASSCCIFVLRLRVASSCCIFVLHLRVASSCQYSLFRKWKNNLFVLLCLMPVSPFWCTNILKKC
jgi:hypothetical protein